jgi:lon-related putative ATP-dependent protease
MDEVVIPPLEPVATPQTLTADELYWRCDEADIPFDSTEELEPLAQHLGQDRAADALRFGLDIQHAGFNIFVLGNTGVGKRELLETLLHEGEVPAHTAPADWCYVNNFDAPDKPIVLQLPAGAGSKLRSDMSGAVEELLAIVPATFQSEEYQSRVQEMGESYQEREKQAFQSLSEQAAKDNIAMIQTPSGYTLAPMKDGQVITPQDFEALPEDDRDATLKIIEKLKDELKSIVRQLPGYKKESREQFRKINREFSQMAIDPVFADLKKTYAGYESVLKYIEAVHANVLDEAESFAQSRDESAIPVNLHDLVREYPQYSVNVLVDNGQLSGAPIIYEDNPSFANLLGRSEHIAEMGTLVTDFTLIKPGALHRANGGYLILEADKVLTSPYAWIALKRALRSRELKIQSLDQIFSFVSTVQLEPEAIPLDVKVVLTGDRYIYYLLQAYDPEFTTLFKVAADMSEDLDRNGGNSLLFARMIRALQQQLGLLPLDQGAVARIIEQAARQMGDGARLSLHRGRLEDLLAESDYIARKDKAGRISATHVAAALDAAQHRMDQFREKSHEGILRDILLVDTTGTAIGQVNGLSVYLLGEYSFGKPSRITATARLGAGKVIDIEREVDLGGKIHSKAVMIISALLARRYAQNRPLPLSATLVFEQSYGGVEGDSASVGELIALISALGDIPVKQTIAVTGSLNQQGQVQAIGGVNEKIEGFYDICKARGLNGEHGVLIPQANTVHLMLREDVREAVQQGQFHVYTAKSIDEALEIMTGQTVSSIDARVNARVEQLQAAVKAFSVSEGDREEGADDH